MLKAGSKRRRTKVEVEEAKEEERLRREGRERQQQQILELQEQLRQMQQAQENNAVAANILRGWIANGQVQQDQNGECRILQADNRSEQQQRRMPDSFSQNNSVANEQQNEMEELN